MVTRGVWTLGAGLVTALMACTGAKAQVATVDLKGCTIVDERVLAADGTERGFVEANRELGAQTLITADGGLVFRGQRYSEATATLRPQGQVDPRAYVFETRFVMMPVHGFYTRMVILSPRVAMGAGGPGYRISYRFATACAFAWNNTGFYLNHTGTEEYRKDPMYVGPIAGGRYRLTPGREYIAYSVVEDLETGTRIRFYLHDTTLQEDDAEPLLDYTDSSAERIGPQESIQVQVGNGGLVDPASPVWFGGMRVYSLERFAAERRDRAPTAQLPTQELTVAPDPPETRLPNVFSDSMVLQRGKPIPVWGRGVDGDEVVVSLAGAEAKVQVVDGRFRAELPALEAGGPYELRVKGSDRTLVVHDVLVGEVWALGGQSNMGFWLRVVADADAEIARSDCPTIRVFSGWHPSADVPQFDVGGGTWKVISPELNGQFSALGYYLARGLQERLGVPVGLLDISTPATGIECWLSTRAAEEVWGEELYRVPGRYPVGMQDPGCHYNGKVAPVMPYAIAGMVWYQGDGSNAATGLAYRRYIPALIRDWREGFAQGDLPFLVVQIPIFEGCSPEMRESQLLASLTEPKVGLAVALETGDPKDIHPPNKRPVGDRLVLLARALAYGDEVECMGPTLQETGVRDGEAHLVFGHAAGGLVLKGEGGFEVRDAEGRWVKARARLVGDDEVAVGSDEVPVPTGVRYAWAPVPEVTLFNGVGLPASPFRTRED